MAQIDIKNCFLRICDGRRASLTSVSVPANSKLLFTDADYHRGTRWQVVDPVRVRIVVAGTTTPLSVSVTGKDVTINSATDGGGLATSTANQIIAALLASAPATALLGAVNFGGSTGAGIPDAFAFTALGNGPRAFTIKIGDGNLTWDEKVNRIYFKDRGVLDAVRNGDEEPMDVKFGLAYEFLEGVPSPAAQVVSANQAPFVLATGQTLVIAFDAGGSQTFTFTGVAATRAGGAPTLPPAANSTLQVAFDGGSTQLITFDGTESTPTLLAAKINLSLSTGQAVVNGANVDLKSSIAGTGSHVQVVGGTALAAIGHTIGTTNGSGNVANIAAVTLVDVFSVTAGVTNGTVTSDGFNHVLLTSAVSGPTSTAQVMPTSTAVGFGFNTEQQTSGTPTVEDALKQRGNGAVWISTSPDTCEPYCVDLELEYDAPCTPPRKEFATFQMFRFETLDHDPKASQISCAGKCNTTQAAIAEF